MSQLLLPTPLHDFETTALSHILPTPVPLASEGIAAFFNFDLAFGPLPSVAHCKELHAQTLQGESACERLIAMGAIPALLHKCKEGTYKEIGWSLACLDQMTNYNTCRQMISMEFNFMYAIEQLLREQHSAKSHIARFCIRIFSKMSKNSCNSLILVNSQHLLRLLTTKMCKDPLVMIVFINLFSFTACFTKKLLFFFPALARLAVDYMLQPVTQSNMLVHQQAVQLLRKMSSIYGWAAEANKPGLYGTAVLMNRTAASTLMLSNAFQNIVYKIPSKESLKHVAICIYNFTVCTKGFKELTYAATIPFEHVAQMCCAILSYEDLCENAYTYAAAAVYSLSYNELIHPFLCEHFAVLQNIMAQFDNPLIQAHIYVNSVFQNVQMRVMPQVPVSIPMPTDMHIVEF